MQEKGEVMQLMMGETGDNAEPRFKTEVNMEKTVF